jgi:hypothetical protein
VPELANAAEQAAEAEPPVRTFVIGLGPLLPNLDQISNSGGTGAALQIGEGEVTTPLLEALKSIVMSPFTCQFSLPEAGGSTDPLDFDQVRMLALPYPSDPEYVLEIPRIDGPAQCGGSSGGWYYDDNTAPTKMTVCACTCAELSSITVEVEYGCPAVTP